MKYKVFFIFVFLSLKGGCQVSNWIHVGPFSNGDSTQFRTTQFNRVIVNPNNPDHIFAGGIFAGLWESSDGGDNWHNINTDALGSNGVHGMSFIGSTKIIVGNYFNCYKSKFDNPIRYSDKIGVYDFANFSWYLLSPLPISQKYVIKDLVCFPGNPNIIFACTSVGLYRSSNGGNTWNEIVDGFIENMTFIKKPGKGNNYFVFLAGSNLEGDYDEPLGKALFMESIDNGNTFLDVMTGSTMFQGTMADRNGTNFLRSHMMICLGNQSTHPNLKDLFLYCVVSKGTAQPWDPNGWDYNNPNEVNHSIFQIQKDINSNNFPTSLINISALNTVTGLGTATNGLSGSVARMAICYDPINNGVWFGGIYPAYYRLTNNTIFFNYNSNFWLHLDIHDIVFASKNNSQNKRVYVACDGGIYKLDVINPPPICLSNTQYPVANLNNPCKAQFALSNNHLNVSLVNGFAGDPNNPDKYIIGQQDMPAVDVFESNGVSQGQYLFKLLSGESDGGFIDKFNSNRIIYDYQSYDDDTYYSIDGVNFLKMMPKPFCLPHSSPPFSNSNLLPYYSTARTFTTKNIVQDPFRKGRIFFVKNNDGLFLLDTISQKFLLKMKPYNVQHPNSNSFEIDPWRNEIVSISFSQRNPNTMYVLMDGLVIDEQQNRYSRPTVLKYIGNDIDSTWYGFNERYYLQNGQSYPQWTSLTLNLWENLSLIPNCSGCQNLNGMAMCGVEFKEIETSNWNEDIIYVLAYVPNNPSLKVLKYNGSGWENYSQGLPTNDFPHSMIMDHASNDGLYLSTDKGVYFRSASDATWQYYGIGLPKLFSRQMEINYYENSVRAGTFGRGIFKAPLKCPIQNNLTLVSPAISGYFEANLIGTSGTIISSSTDYCVLRATSSISLNPGFMAIPNSGTKSMFSAFIHGCQIGSRTSNYFTFKNQGNNNGDYEVAENENVSRKKEIIIYPNPTTGNVKFKNNSVVDYTHVQVFDGVGREIFNLKLNNNSEVLFTEKLTGIYFIRFMNKNDGNYSDFQKLVFITE